MTKPTCKLTETDGNVFSIIGKVSSCLKRAKMNTEAEEFSNRVFQCGSYDEVLRLCYACPFKDEKYDEKNVEELNPFDMILACLR